MFAEREPDMPGSGPIHFVQDHPRSTLDAESLGIVLIVIGATFIAQEFLGFNLWRWSWPILIVVPGGRVSPRRLRDGTGRERTGNSRNNDHDPWADLARSEHLQSVAYLGVRLGADLPDVIGIGPVAARVVKRARIRATNRANDGDHWCLDLRRLRRVFRAAFAHEQSIRPRCRRSWCCRHSDSGRGVHPTASLRTKDDVTRSAQRPLVRSRAMPSRGSGTVNPTWQPVLCHSETAVEESGRSLRRPEPGSLGCDLGMTRGGGLALTGAAIRILSFRDRSRGIPSVSSIERGRIPRLRPQDDMERGVDVISPTQPIALQARSNWLDQLPFIGLNRRRVRAD